MSAVSQSNKSSLITNQTQLTHFRNELLKIHINTPKVTVPSSNIRSSYHLQEPNQNNAKHDTEESKVFKDSTLKPQTGSMTNYNPRRNTILGTMNETQVLVWIRSMPTSKLSGTAKDHIIKGMIKYECRGHDLIDADKLDLADKLGINYSEANQLFKIINDSFSQQVFGVLLQYSQCLIERSMQCRGTEFEKDIMEIERKLTNATAKKQISRRCQHNGCNKKAPAQFPNDIYICEKHSKLLAVQLQKASFECKKGTKEEQRICQNLQVSYDAFVDELQNPSMSHKKHVYPKHYFSTSMSKLIYIHQQISNDTKSKKYKTMIEQLMDILIIFRQKMNPWYVTFGMWIIEVIEAVAMAFGEAAVNVVAAPYLLGILCAAISIVSMRFIAKYAFGYDNETAAVITGMACVGAGIGAFAGPVGAAAGGCIGGGIGLIGKGLRMW